MHWALQRVVPAESDPGAPHVAIAPLFGIVVAWPRSNCFKDLVLPDCPDIISHIRRFHPRSIDWEFHVESLVSLPAFKPGQVLESGVEFWLLPCASVWPSVVQFQSSLYFPGVVDSVCYSLDLILQAAFATDAA